MPTSEGLFATRLHDHPKNGSNVEVEADAAAI